MNAANFCVYQSFLGLNSQHFHFITSLGWKTTQCDLKNSNISPSEPEIASTTSIVFSSLQDLVEP